MLSRFVSFSAFASLFILAVANCPQPSTTTVTVTKTDVQTQTDTVTATKTLTSTVTDKQEQTDTITDIITKTQTDLQTTTDFQTTTDTVSTTITIPPVTSTLTVTSTVTAPVVTQTIAPNQCNTGSIQCCNSVETASSSNLVTSLLGLLGVVGVGANTPVGVTCSPITGVGLGSGSSCTQSPVCCTDDSFNGIIAIGCSPININL